jgi:hypothetical protein
MAAAATWVLLAFSATVADQCQFPQAEERKRNFIRNQQPKVREEQSEKEHPVRDIRSPSFANAEVNCVLMYFYL